MVIVARVGGWVGLVHSQIVTEHVIERQASKEGLACRVVGSGAPSKDGPILPIDDFPWIKDTPTSKIK